MTHSWSNRILPCVLVLSLFLGACQRTLVQSPNLLIGEGPAAFADVGEPFRTPDIPVFYVTDRVREKKDGKEGPRYGYGRSPGLAYGTAVVGLSPEGTWDDLVRDSTTRRRQKYALRLESVVEAGSIAPLAPQMEVSEGDFEITEALRQEYLAHADAVYAAMAPWLDATEHKDAYVYVHGFKNTFQDAIFRCAEIWHFSGRRGVPIAFTWPAGSGGGLLGYQHDRESSEFAVHHLKMLLRALARCPQVERVHLISHSRGTDVASSAVRELHIECTAGGQDTADAMKLETLVLAAPDMDAEVFGQRFISETTILAARRTVVYFSKSDSALGLSDFLFSSRRRLGALHVSDVTETQRQRLATFGRLEAIENTAKGDSTSHDYAFANPAAFSDLILVIRDRRKPGAEHGRPLEAPAEGLWRITNEYCRPPDP